MSERRQFQRVALSARCECRHGDTIDQGRLDNISINGALISFRDSVMIPQGEECAITIYFDGEPIPLQFLAQVKYSTMYRVGVHFMSLGNETAATLHRLLEDGADQVVYQPKVEPLASK